MSLNVCRSGHEDIAYEGLDCPLCELEAERDDLQRQLDVAEGDLKTAETTIKELEEDLKFHSDKGPYGP